MSGLPVSDLINVQVNLQPAAAQGPTLNTLLIIGASNVIDPHERLRPYSSIDQVAADFGTTAPEYMAAVLYFEQVPQPSALAIGRWAKTATSALLRGGILTAAQQDMANWTVIANGAFSVSIDGSAHALTGLDFTGQTNLNGIASVVTAALTGAGTMIWNGQQFVISSATTGAGTQAAGTITLDTNPSPSDTLSINGTMLSFIDAAATPVGNQVNVGADANATAANLQIFLGASLDLNLIACRYATALNVLSVTAILPGVDGNLITLATTSTAISLSGATLAGGTPPSSVSYATAGTGQDLSGPMKLTSSLAAPLVAGLAAETPLACVNTLVNGFSGQFLGIMFADASVTDLQHQAVASYIEADQDHLYGLTTQNTEVLDPTSTTDIASVFKALAFKFSIVQYSSENAYAVASLFGRLLTVNFAGNNTVITLMYKQEPGIVAETLSETQMQALLAKRANVFVNYNNNTAIIQPGITPSGLFADSVYNALWFKFQIQTAVYNLFYASTLKVPQTDAGNHLVKTVIETQCALGVANGYIGPGVWGASGFGTLSQGDFLAKGFYVYAPPIASQSQADRSARKSVLFQVAAKETGAIHSANILVSVNQ
jgi:hypothetical protein